MFIFDVFESWIEKRQNVFWFITFAMMSFSIIFMCLTTPKELRGRLDVGLKEILGTQREIKKEILGTQKNLEKKQLNITKRLDLIIDMEEHNVRSSIKENSRYSGNKAGSLDSVSIIDRSFVLQGNKAIY